MARKTPKAPSFSGDIAQTIFAAWQGVYHLFGGRGSFSLGEDGFTLSDLTVGEGFDVNEIVADLTVRDDTIVKHTVPFSPETLSWFSGEAPAPFTNAPELTDWISKFMKRKIDSGKNRSPQYAKDAIAVYKEANGFAVPRGRPRKVNLDILKALDEEALRSVPMEELTSLRETLDSAIAAPREAVEA